MVAVAAQVRDDAEAAGQQQLPACPAWAAAAATAGTLTSRSMQPNARGRLFFVTEQLKCPTNLSRVYVFSFNPLLRSFFGKDIHLFILFKTKQSFCHTHRKSNIFSFFISFLQIIAKSWKTLYLLVSTKCILQNVWIYIVSKKTTIEQFRFMIISFFLVPIFFIKNSDCIATNLFL